MIPSYVFLPANFTLAAEMKQETNNPHIAALASMRLNFLSQEIQMAKINWGFPFIQLLLVVRILSPWIRTGINWAAQKTSDAVIDSIAEKVDHAFTRCEEAMDHVVARFDPFIVATTTVAYIALLVLGHTLIAAIGLTSIALIALERLAWIPKPVTKILEGLGRLSMLAISIITPTYLIIRILCIAVSAIDLIEYACRFIPSAESSENKA